MFLSHCFLWLTCYIWQSPLWYLCLVSGDLQIWLCQVSHAVWLTYKYFSILSWGMIFSRPISIFGGWAEKYLYFGGCVTKGLNILEYSLSDYKNILISSKNKDTFSPGIRLLGIIRLLRAHTPKSLWVSSTCMFHQAIFLQRYLLLCLILCIGDT